MRMKFVLLTTAIGLISAPVFAADCKLNGKQPMPIDQAVKAAQSLGYQEITQVGLERGCYEFEAKDKNGKKPVEFKLNAATGEFVNERRDISKSLTP